MSKGKRVRAQRRAAPPPPVGKRQPLDRRWWIGGAAVVALVVVGVAVAAIRSNGSSAKPVLVDFAAMSGLQSGAPPWNNGSGELQQRLSDVHLDPLPQEQLAFLVLKAHEEIVVATGRTPAHVPSSYAFPAGE